MEITEIAIRRLQRALNAFGRGTEVPRVRVDGRLGRRTAASLIRFLAEHGPQGEAALARALAALEIDRDTAGH